MKVAIALLSVLYLGACSTAPVAATLATLSFRIGATVGRDGPCAPLYRDTTLGYQYFFDWLARRPAQMVTDATGRTYVVQLQLRLVSHDCTEEGRAAAMASLINGTQADPATGAAAAPPVHMLLGGNGINALQDAVQADAASRLLLHCCTARDSVFQMNLRHVYGMFTPASMYTGTVLRTIALRGMKRVAVVYTTESLLHAQLCKGALDQLLPLGELRPGFGSVLTVNYTAAEAQAPGFWERTSSRVAAAGADVLVACDEMSHTSLLVHQLRTQGHRLSAVWLASWGNVEDFLRLLDNRSEYVLTTVQWMPSLPYADPDFGTAAQFASAFAAATKEQASYFSAAATASGYVLLTALQRAIAMCDLGNMSGLDAADSFMWQDGVLKCFDPSHRVMDVTGGTGSAILSYVLNTLNMETFFGPVGFNGYRQNIYHPAVVTQVLSGDLVAVLPLDVADKALVMPIPDETAAKKPWSATVTGISIITLLCTMGAVCLALGVLMCRRHFTAHLHGLTTVEVKSEDIQVDIAPVVNADGTSEPGEGVYRGTRVKLVVATELLQGGPAKVQRQNAVSPSGILFEERDSGTPRNLDRRSFPGISGGTAASRLQHAKTSIEDALPGNQGSEPPLSDRGFFRRQSEVGLRKQSEGGYTMPRISTGLQGPQGLLGGASRASLFGTLSQRNRRQILAMMWRAVRLQHPRVCAIIGIVWEWPGLLEGGGTVPVVVRQWHEFDNLDRLLENETVPLPLLTKGSIAHGVAEGLAYLHAQEPSIVAGPLEASRIIIDSHFNPHLFLRLRNLEPEYGNEQTRVRQRSVSAFGSRPNLTQTWSVAVPAPPPLRITAADPGGQAASTAVMPFGVAIAADGPQLSRISIGIPAGIVMGANAAGFQVVAESPLPAMLRQGGTFGPAPRYTPRKEQDVYEYGLLLCKIFIVTSPSDSGRLRFAARFTNAPCLDVESPGPGAAATPTLQPAPAAIDEEELESALGELDDICPQLANLARSCLGGDSELTFPIIARILEQDVIPSLAGRGGKRNTLAVYGGQERGTSLRLGAGLAAELRSVSSTCGRGGHPLTVGRSGGSVTKADHLRGVHPNLGVLTPDDLIYEIFPPKVAKALQAGEAVQPERYECVSIFFSDVVGYTDLCAQLQPGEVMDLVHRLYSRFDDLIRGLQLFKVETVGDAYLAVGNLRWPQPDAHARLMTQFAFAAVNAANTLPVHPDRPELGFVHVRVGLHCGPVVGSVVGTLNRRYCLFGDAVNTAARMEHNSKVDRVHCSAAFAALLREQWPDGAGIVSRGIMPIKGKGPMETFWVEERKSGVAGVGCEVLSLRVDCAEDEDTV